MLFWPDFLCDNLPHPCNTPRYAYAVEAIFERWPDPNQCPEAAKDPPGTAMLVRKKTNRTASPEDEAILVLRINSVLASARRRFPDRSKWPSFRGMAQALVRVFRGNDKH
jgi:hypothetical protein